MTKDFIADFHRFKNKILSKENFAYARYADGEVKLMTGQGVGVNTQAYQRDGWSCESRVYKLGKVLNDSISHTESNYCYAITSPNQNYSEYQYLRNLIKQPEENITFADLWINGNYNKFKHFIHHELNEKIVLIASEKGLNVDHAPLQVEEYIPIPSDCVNYYEQNDEYVRNKFQGLAKKYKDTLFLISAGPLSEAIIHLMYSTNPLNRYIDVGSSVDEIVHKQITRPYMIENTIYNKEIVQWTI